MVEVSTQKHMKIYSTKPDPFRTSRTLLNHTNQKPTGSYSKLTKMTTQESAPTSISPEQFSNESVTGNKMRQLGTQYV